MTSTQLGIEGNKVSAAALAEGTQPFEYEITGLISEGDFGIVYLAFDPTSRERIAIREYLPAALAVRSVGAPDVVVKSERHVDLESARSTSSELHDEMGPLQHVAMG